MNTDNATLEAGPQEAGVPAPPTPQAAPPAGTGRSSIPTSDMREHRPKDTMVQTFHSHPGVELHVRKLCSFSQNPPHRRTFCFYSLDSV